MLTPALEIDVVLITLNEERHIDQSVSQARKALDESGAVGDVIVVDSGSEDGTIAAALKHPCRVVSIDAPDGSRCPALGRRVGTEVSKSEWIWFLDGDMLASPSFLERAIEVIAEGEVAVTGWMDDILADGTRIPNVKRYQTGASYTKRFGGALLIRADILRAVGGWDHRISASEELDLSVRLAAEGYRVRLLPVRIGDHLGREKRSASLVQRVLPYPWGQARNRGVAEAVGVWIVEDRLKGTVQQYPAPMAVWAGGLLSLALARRSFRASFLVAAATTWAGGGRLHRVLHHAVLGMQWMAALVWRPAVRQGDLPPYELLRETTR